MKYLVKDDRSECRGRHGPKSKIPDGWHVEDGTVDSAPHDHETQAKADPVFVINGDNTVTELHAVTDRTQAEIDANARAREDDQFDGNKMLKAVAIWAAKEFGKPLGTAKTEILTEYRKL